VFGKDTDLLSKAAWQALVVIVEKYDEFAPRLR
jgi:hypothetical protein